MLATVNKFFVDNSNAILRTLGASAILGSVAAFAYAENKGAGEHSDVKVQRLTLHNAVLAFGATLTLWTLTTGNKIGTKTRLFCLATTAAAAMYPTALAKVANAVRPNVNSSAPV